MSSSADIQRKLKSGEELEYEEFQKLLARKEEIDDLLDLFRGNQFRIMEEDFAFRSGGSGVAIVVGHTQIAPGASGGPPISQSEYPWNRDLATRIKAHCGILGVESKIFFRDIVGIGGAYQQVSQWGARCVFELHFNSFNGTAKGTETLFDKDRNSGSRAWAQRLQSAMLGALGTNDRGLKECDSGDRGFASVSALNIPSALIEPFFGDNVSDATKGHNNKDDLAIALAEAAAAQVATA